MSQERKVTEDMLRPKALRGVPLEGLELNAYGRVVRKDRFETCLNRLSVYMYNSRNIWFPDTLVSDAHAFAHFFDSFVPMDDDAFDYVEFNDVPQSAPEATVVACLEDGSILQGCTLKRQDNGLVLVWMGMEIKQPIVGIRQYTKEGAEFVTLAVKKELLNGSTIDKGDYEKQIDPEEPARSMSSPPSKAWELINKST